MSEAFVAYVRFEEKLLLLRRGKSDGDFPGLWDGVWGVGDTPEEVLAMFRNPLVFLWIHFTITAQDPNVVSTWVARWLMLSPFS